MPASDLRPTIPCLPIAHIELPPEVSRLYDLAYNLWWSWNPRARALFRRIDPEIWELYSNPVQLLINVERGRWYALLSDPEFIAEYEAVTAELEAYTGDTATWFDRRQAEPDSSELSGPIAYFSMEYGLHQSLAVYSGGLGVLSGDHCKSASDLGLPFVALGLLYRHGYFHQTLDHEGVQQHFYPAYDFSRLALRPARGADGREVVVSVPLPDREVKARVWVAQVGRVQLLLLDTHVADNDPADQPITNALYVRGREMRLVQEIVAGVGGVKALAALGIEPAVWHINEGHCALLQLERLRRQVAAGGTAADALGAIARDAVFTTHTPVKAGNEQFDRQLARRYLAPWTGGTGLAMDDLLALGASGQAGDNSFNLTALALKTSRWANAVSRLNAEVTTDMWRSVLADRNGGQAGVIHPITNGIHTPTWVGGEVRRLFESTFGDGWPEHLLAGEEWHRIEQLPDRDLWDAHLAQKRRLARFASRRWREQFARQGLSPDELRAVGRRFNVDALTIGFARRFATYKRAKLIFTDMERFKQLVGDSERPLQILFAGKAHPADRPGQELIQQIFQLSRSDELKGKVFFIEDYDMLVGQRLVQGVDLWLNTPRRPLEASGTSGQKAGMNGALNCSILDGWWPEGYDGENGWVIGEPQATHDSEEEQDRADAESLYEILAEEIIPTYYDRDEEGLPRRWLARMKRSIATVTPLFSSSRMVRDYTEQAYLPAAERALKG